MMSNNPISSAGCIGIAKLLESSTTAIEFSICYTNIGDDGADMVANSLIHNNKLYLLEMDDNKMTERGCVSFLKLICGDMTSIESTYNSNHTLYDMVLPFDAHRMIEKNQEENGRTKVINLQLNSSKREELHRLQGIPYCYDSIFAEIDPLVLPEVLAVVASEHEQTELFRMLVHSVSDLFSTVNRKMVVKQKLADKTAEMEDLSAKMAALSAKMVDLSAEMSELREELEHC